MGFCSGTDIFDPMVEAILNLQSVSDRQRRDVIRALVIALEDHDWDCQSESRYYDNWHVQRVFKELHPDWFAEAK
jgi:hypothetical protein